MKCYSELASSCFHLANESEFLAEFRLSALIKNLEQQVVSRDV